MTRDRWLQISAALDEILDCPEAERAIALDRLGSRDASLRTEVERLLAADASAGGFLEHPLPAFDDPDNQPGGFDGSAEPAVGERVGVYQIVRQVGRGGMGAVYLAERADGAFEQRVAVKMIHSGLITSDERERFLQERRILAALEHPHIARVFDGGVTADGRPYFVMEYVEGQPITRYCRARRLDLHDRLRLLVDVCLAIEVAHRHFVVHRDLKPSNILVTGDGRVKLLDFGIAKLLTVSSPDSEPITRVPAMTPEYAAPEQLRGGTITTATDVYALGAVLYEMLTARRPYEASSFHELAATVRHGTPARPSAILSGRDEMEKAGLDGAIGRVRRVLRGDLDTIVMTALRAEPERRYPSAEALRGDIERFLAHLPIRARPDSRSYRIGRFMRRHRVAVTAAAIVVLSLVAGLAGTFWEARVASHHARRAEAAQTFMADVFRLSAPGESAGRSVTAKEILDLASRRVDIELAADPEIQADMLTFIGRIYLQLGLYPEAKRLLERGLVVRRGLYGAERAEIADSLDALGTLRVKQGNYAEATNTFQEALAVLGRIGRPADTASVTTLNHLSDAEIQRGDYQSAENTAQTALSLSRRLYGPSHPAVADGLELLARVRRSRGDFDGAQTLNREALDIRRSHFGNDHPEVVRSLSNAALDVFERGHYAEAEDLYRRALASAKQALGPDHPDTLDLLSNLAAAVTQQGKLLAGEVLLREALEARQLRLGADHPSLVPTLTRLAWTTSRLGREDEAESLYRQALAIARAKLPPGHDQIADVSVGLAGTLVRTGRKAEAQSLLREAVTIRSKAFGVRDERTLAAVAALNDLDHAAAR
jgi:eukaryotic-like serine/threonine-protein kinase